MPYSPGSVIRKFISEAPNVVGLGLAIWGLLFSAGIAHEIAGLYGLMVIIILLLLNVLVGYKDIASSSCHSLKTKKNEIGKEIVEHVQSAKEIIRVVHSSVDNPSDIYDASVLSMISSGVRLERIIPIGLLERENIKAWLQKYDGCESEEYELIRISGSAFRLQMNIVIIDDRITVAYFPGPGGSPSLTDVLVFKDRTVILMFLKVFDKLRLHRQEGPK